MKISTAFPSRYLKAAEVTAMGGRLQYTIRKVVIEEVGQDKTAKPVAYFQQIRQGLVISKTNAARLSASLGDETDDWTGKEVVLEVERVPMRGQLVDSIKAYVDGAFLVERRTPTLLESQRAAQQPPDQGGDRLDDEIPF
jgi:hypothetical protein